MSLIIAKNKVEFEQLKNVATPDGTDSFTPIPHARLVELTHEAINRAGLSVAQEEHSLGRGGLRYFGGFALKGLDIDGSDREIVLGLRNAHDKTFAASVCVGNRMLVCENLCFSSDIKLARRHTTNIFADLPRVLSEQTVPPICWCILWIPRHSPPATSTTPCRSSATRATKSSRAALSGRFTTA